MNQKLSEVKEEKLKVKLISNTENPEKIIATAAKLCYSNKDIEGTLAKSNKEEDEKFVEMLSNMGHESPLEHVSFTFGIEGVSRSLTHQLVRHRIGFSYSQKSQRYVSEDGFNYILPPEIEKNEEVKKEFINTMEIINQAYNKIGSKLKKIHKDEYILSGKTEKEASKLASKKAMEDARFILPNSCETKIIVTMNARALLNFFSHRLCNRAQWEIREMAIEILKIVKNLLPSVFKGVGPKCLSGKCPEGSMSCGNIKEVKEFFYEKL